MDEEDRDVCYVSKDCGGSGGGRAAIGGGLEGGDGGGRAATGGAQPVCGFSGGVFVEEGPGERVPRG